MHYVVYAFWAGVLGALCVALWDCTRWPRQTSDAWNRFRPVAAAIVLIAVGFFLINLVRLGAGEAGWLIACSLRLASVAVTASVFFCGGWPWVTRAGHVGLFERIRRQVAGLPTPSVRNAAAETVLVSAAVVLFSVGFLWLFTQVIGEPEKSASFRELLEMPAAPKAHAAYIGLMFLLAPLWEETTFRWYLQNRVEEALGGRRGAHAIAIVAGAAVWACGHAALTDPAWFKLVQIFTVGCLLGWRFRVIGLSGCVVAHMAMNLPAVLDLL
jgi:membrane protease YdiL (CAAX protease family)